LEADDQGVGGFGEEHIAVGDLSYGAVNDVDLDFAGGEFDEGVGDGLEGAADIGFDDEIELFGLTGSDSFQDAGGEASAFMFFAEFGSAMGHISGKGFFFQDIESFSDVGYAA
jgi:hypothetical protein